MRFISLKVSHALPMEGCISGIEFIARHVILSSVEESN